MIENEEVLVILRDLDTKAFLNPPLVTVNCYKCFCAGVCFRLCLFILQEQWDSDVGEGLQGLL